MRGRAEGRRSYARFWPDAAHRHVLRGCEKQDRFEVNRGSSRDFCASSYHLATPGIAAKVKAKREHIYLDQRFSDHAPLIIDYEFKLWAWPPPAPELR